MLAFAVRHYPLVVHHHAVPAGHSTHWAAIFATIFGALTAIFAALAAAGAAFAGFQVREARLARLAAAANDLAAKWSSPALEEARELVGKFQTPGDLADAFDEARANNTHDYYVLVREPNFFEDLGVSVELEALDIELLRRSLGSVVVTRWLQWSDAISRMREAERPVTIRPQDGHDFAFSEFEGLAKRMARELGDPLPENGSG